MRPVFKMKTQIAVVISAINESYATDLTKRDAITHLLISVFHCVVISKLAEDLSSRNLAGRSFGNSHFQKFLTLFDLPKR